MTLPEWKALRENYERVDQMIDSHFFDTAPRTLPRSMSTNGQGQEAMGSSVDRPTAQVHDEADNPPNYSIDEEHTQNYFNIV